MSDSDNNNGQSNVNPPAEPEAVRPADVDDELLEDFKAEASEHLQVIESNLLQWEQNPGNKECVHAIFGPMHSIKGGANYLGLSHTGTLAHALENMLARLRKGELQVNRDIIDTLLLGVDFIKTLLRELAHDGWEKSSTRTLVDMVQQVSASGKLPATMPPTAQPPSNKPAKPAASASQPVATPSPAKTSAHTVSATPAPAAEPKAGTATPTHKASASGPQPKVAPAAKSGSITAAGQPKNAGQFVDGYRAQQQQIRTSLAQLSQKTGEASKMLCGIFLQLQTAGSFVGLTRIAELSDFLAKTCIGLYEKKIKVVPYALATLSEGATYLERLVNEVSACGEEQSDLRPMIAAFSQIEFADALAYDPENEFWEEATQSVKEIQDGLQLIAKKGYQIGIYEDIIGSMSNLKGICFRLGYLPLAKLVGTMATLANILLFGELELFPRVYLVFSKALALISSVLPQIKKKQGSMVDTSILVADIEKLLERRKGSIKKKASDKVAKETEKSLPNLYALFLEFEKKPTLKTLAPFKKAVGVLEHYLIDKDVEYYWSATQFLLEQMDAIESKGKMVADDIYVLLGTLQELDEMVIIGRGERGDEERLLRDKMPLADRIKSIAGMTPNRAQNLIKRYTTLEALQKATIEGLTQVEGITPIMARRIVIEFKSAQRQVTQSLTLVAAIDEQLEQRKGIADSGDEEQFRIFFEYGKQQLHKVAQILLEGSQSKQETRTVLVTLQTASNYMGYHELTQHLLALLCFVNDQPDERITVAALEHIKQQLLAVAAIFPLFVQPTSRRSQSIQEAPRPQQCGMDKLAVSEGAAPSVTAHVQATGKEDAMPPVPESAKTLPSAPSQGGSMSQGEQEKQEMLNIFISQVEDDMDALFQTLAGLQPDQTDISPLKDIHTIFKNFEKAANQLNFQDLSLLLMKDMNSLEEIFQGAALSDLRIGHLRETVANISDFIRELKGEEIEPAMPAGYFDEQEITGQTTPNNTPSKPLPTSPAASTQVYDDGRSMPAGQIYLDKTMLDVPSSPHIMPPLAAPKPSVHDSQMQTRTQPAVSGAQSVAAKANDKNGSGGQSGRQPAVDVGKTIVPGKTDMAKTMAPDGEPGILIMPEGEETGLQQMPPAAPAASPSVQPTSPPSVQPAVLPQAEAASAAAGEERDGDYVVDTTNFQEFEGVKEDMQSHTLRVNTLKVDEMMNLVGELVVNRASFDLIGQDVKNLYRQFLAAGILSKEQARDFKLMIGRIDSSSLELGRIANELQGGVMRVRMVPMDVLFKRLPRIVRELSKKLGKMVKLEMYGETTELDKIVIEEITDPLMHLMRNMIDHGIEMPDERRTKGKHAYGTIEVSAYHEGNQVVIELVDDGRGINIEQIRRRVIEQNLATSTEAARMGENDLLNMLYHPGFSMTNQVSMTSGRGVGMGVVKANITKIGGTVEIETELGAYTCFIIKIPLTLAIIQALLVKIAGATYCIPISSVQEVVKVKKEDIYVLDGQRVMRLRDSVLPLLDPCRIFHLPADDGLPMEFVVVIQTGHRYSGLLVQKLLGGQDIVIKSLHDDLVDTPGISGATLLGDGSVSLILDIPGFMNLAHEQA